MLTRAEEPDRPPTRRQVQVSVEEGSRLSAAGDLENGEKTATARPAST